MKALYVTQNFKTVEEVKLECVERPMPKVKKGEVLVRIAASGINPSDARATMGYFPDTQVPRIPGRDFAGVVEGGKKVWGTGGAVGIASDGTHAEFAAIPEAGLAEIPTSMSLLVAGAQPLPYTTAYFGLVTRAHIARGESVLVIGALGQVGRAAMSICRWKGCTPIALVRKPEEVEEAKKLGWEAYSEIPAALKVDVVLNSIGNLNWEKQIGSLKEFGRMVVIAALPGQREAPLNLFNMYRNNQEIHGINTLDLDHAFNAKLLNEMKPGFESGALIPLTPDPVFSLEDATTAYKMVLHGSSGKRVVLQM